MSQRVSRRSAGRWPWGRKKSLFVPVFIWCVLAPCGLCHLYVGRWLRGLGLMAVYFGSVVALSHDHAWAMFPMVGVYVVDLIGGSEAVLAHNRRLTSDPESA